VRYVPDGSLCTASVEQIFPRDGVQRNCFELALYHECISNRIGSGIRNCAPNAVGARSRDHRAEPSSVLGDMLLALHRRATRSHRRPMAMPLAAAPYRASGLVHWHFSDLTRPGWRRLFLRGKRTAAANVLTDTVVSRHTHTSSAKPRLARGFSFAGRSALSCCSARDVGACVGAGSLTLW
jgi:hypothetical protein